MEEYIEKIREEIETLRVKSDDENPEKNYTLEEYQLRFDIIRNQYPYKFDTDITNLSEDQIKIKYDAIITEIKQEENKYTYEDIIKMRDFIIDNDINCPVEKLYDVLPPSYQGLLDNRNNISPGDVNVDTIKLFVYAYVMVLDSDLLSDDKRKTIKQLLMGFILVDKCTIM